MRRSYIQKLHTQAVSDWDSENKQKIVENIRVLNVEINKRHNESDEAVRQYKKLIY